MCSPAFLDHQSFFFLEGSCDGQVPLHQHQFLCLALKTLSLVPLPLLSEPDTRKPSVASVDLHRRGIFWYLCGQAGDFWQGDLCPLVISSDFISWGSL